MNADRSRFETNRAEHLKGLIKAMRAGNPRLSFVAAWNRLQHQRPDLFVEVPERGSANHHGKWANMASAVGVPVKVMVGPIDLEGEAWDRFVADFVAWEKGRR